VEIRVYTSREAAEFGRMLLEGSGIPSFVRLDDCGGMQPYLNLVRGARLVVRQKNATFTSAICNPTIPVQTGIKMLGIYVFLKGSNNEQETVDCNVGCHSDRRANVRFSTILTTLQHWIHKIRGLSVYRVEKTEELPHKHLAVGRPATGSRYCGNRSNRHTENKAALIPIGVTACG